MPSHQCRVNKKSPPVNMSDSKKGKKQRFSMRPASDVVQRIIWDDKIDSADVIVGYEDRFVGIMERQFDLFNWTDDLCSLSHLAVAIPQHRIMYFKLRNGVLWDRPARIDNLFGSMGGMKLEAFLAHLEEQEELAALEAQAQAQAAMEAEANEHEDADDDDDDDEDRQSEQSDEHEHVYRGYRRPRPVEVNDVQGADDFENWW